MSRRVNESLRIQAQVLIAARQEDAWWLCSFSRACHERLQVAELTRMFRQGRERPQGVTRFEQEVQDREQ